MMDERLSGMVYMKIEDLVGMLDDVDFTESSLIGLRIADSSACHPSLLLYVPAPGGTLPQVLSGHFVTIF